MIGALCRIGTAQGCVAGRGNLAFAAVEEGRGGALRRHAWEGISEMATLSINCPHCGTKAQARSTRVLTPLVKNAFFQCPNVECGHTFSAQLAITHTIASSACPNPEIALPVSPPRVRPSNDNGGAEVPPPIGLVPAPIAATA